MFRPPPPQTTPEADRAPDWVAGGTPSGLLRDLESLLGADRVLARATDLIAYASDASPYRLIPKAVVMAHDAGDIAKVLAYGRSAGVPVTFRAAGTSLNGQAQTEGILVDVRRHWRGLRIEDGGASVRVKPGTLLGHVNRALATYQRRIGPDPASTDIATVGGVIANNSGGMRCGVVADAYSTLRSLTFVLASGTVIDTAAPDAAPRFAAAEPALAAGLAQIRDEIRADGELAARIRRKFAIKNTTGYRLCAFLDADEPVEIFARLLVGSEGTLGFIAEAVLDTVPHGRHTSTAMLFFASIEEAAEPVAALVEAGATAVELMVNQSLIAASWMLPGVPEEWRELEMDGAALLVELRSEDPAALDEPERLALAALDGLPLVEPAAFTRDQAVSGVFWHVREGMLGVVGLARTPGAALITEDVCVPPERIAEGAADIRALLGEHGFLTGCAGHASAGNLHFLLTPDMTQQADRGRYEAFMAGLVDLIVDKYDGSLKAEHGTGRNMAPYVAREWGEPATTMMWRIKALADPDGVLNPGSVLSRDPAIHLDHLKSAPAIEEAGRAHLCIECGFCEPVCPSRDLTTTPRQRIVLRREVARQPAGSPVARALLDQYGYDGVETCAVDGSCATVCPLGIDTGALIKDVRTRAHSPRAERLATRAAARYGAVERAARAGLRVGGAVSRVAGDRRVSAASRALRRVAGDDLIPQWSEAMPRAATRRLPETTRVGAAAVYLPACINRIFGSSRQADAGRLSLPEAVAAVSQRAGRPVWIPPDTAGTCCATPWSSKGYQAGHAAMAARTVANILRWTDGGKLPLLIDATSCAHGLKTELAGTLDEATATRWAAVEVIDPVAWAASLVPLLQVRAPAASVAVHPTCSSRHLGNPDALAAVAAALADDVVVPLTATCCGFAGDRGMLHPELTASATRAEAAEVAAARAEVFVSANRTCEIGLEQATGRPYESVVLALERATR